jgi:hypothetical protein
VRSVDQVFLRLSAAAVLFGFYSPATSPTKVDVLPMLGFYPPPYVPTELAKAFVIYACSGYLLIIGWNAKLLRDRTKSAMARRQSLSNQRLTASNWARRVSWSSALRTSCRSSYGIRLLSRHALSSIDACARIRPVAASSSNG